MLLTYTRSTNHSSEKERGKAGLLLKDYRTGNSFMAVLSEVKFQLPVIRARRSRSAAANDRSNIPKRTRSGRG
jgi:hypothetical protein